MIYVASLSEDTKDKMKGYYPIKSMEGLEKLVANNHSFNRVIIKGDFATKYFTPSGLSVFIDNSKAVNRNLVIELDESVDAIRMDAMINNLNTVKTLQDLLFYATKYEKEVIDCIHYMSGKEQSRFEDLLAASSTVSRLQSIIDSKNKDIDDLHYQLDIEQSNKVALANRLSALVSRINYQYGYNIDANVLFNVDKNSYDKILYIKEITRVQYTDSLVYYLKEIFKTLYSMPARVLTIEGYYATGKVRQYPDLKPHYALKDNDVINGDILMLGMQPKLMADILRNPSNISILIILDRGGYEKPHTNGDNVEFLFTASDTKDVPSDIPLSRIISYGKDTLYIPMLKDFETMDASKRIARYSSTSIVKQIVRLMEEGGN